MDARAGRHVLAHVVHADIHELHRVERAAAEMRRRGGVRGAAVKVKSMRVLASDPASFTPENEAGCQEMAISTSLKAPARTMKPLAAPPSSAGQP